jgi:hypothetical protein
MCPPHRKRFVVGAARDEWGALVPTPSSFRHYVRSAGILPTAAHRQERDSRQERTCLSPTNERVVESGWPRHHCSRERSVTCSRWSFGRSDVVVGRHRMGSSVQRRRSPVV